jgi:oligo-1,6-glucosidase
MFCMDQKYFRSHVVYQIYPRSFCDSNGDGIGDIPGIISKLDYLKDLGIGIIWLSPVYRSPNADFGYDISDYEDINPDYGTMADMDNLLSEAKKRGIRIVMDLVINHTSDEHKWFIASKDPSSPYRNYYYWREGKKNNTLPPNNWTSNFGGSAWTYVPEAKGWYLHLFSKKQPDLDWHNPKVLEEVESLLRFWMDKGVYGFRCDVINQIWKESLDDGKKTPYVIGAEHYMMKDNNHAILRKFHDDVFSKYDSMTVGETYNVDYVNARRFCDNELDMCFQFDHMNVDKFIVPIFNRPYHPARMKKILFGWQKEVDWNANYFENHDQVRSVERFGDAKRYWKESAKMLAMLLLTLRGTPYVYEGEEIGMLNYPMFKPADYVDPVNTYIYNLLVSKHFPKKQALKLVQHYNRDNARIPMQWANAPQAGFSSGKKTWLPVNPNYPKINVEDEAKDETSILSFYKALIALRNKDPILCYGSLDPIQTPGRIMAYYRSYEGKMELIVLNLSKHRAFLPKELNSLVGQVVFSNYKGAGFTYKKSLRPYESLIVKIK